MIQIRSGQILSGESPSLRFAIYGFLPYTIFIIVFDETNEIHDTTESRPPYSNLRQDWSLVGVMQLQHWYSNWYVAFIVYLS